MNTRPVFFAASLSFTLLLSAETPSAWISLFDGETLTGWSKHGGEATYRVEDGAIVGTNGPGINTFLCSDQSFGNFELEFEVKLEAPINSGVQIRSKIKNAERRGEMAEVVFGPQVEIEQGIAEAGYIYGESLPGGWMTPPEKLIPHDTFKTGEWNHYRILAQGARIQTFINGRQISDLVDEAVYETHSTGLVGLQVHSTKAEPGTQSVRWRNLRIRQMEDHAPSPEVGE